LEFEGAPGYDLKSISLEARSSGIRLLNVRTRGDGPGAVQLATVYVPKSKTAHFLKKIQDYENENTEPNALGQTKPKNESLVASIDDIKIALLRAFWTDDAAKLPRSDEHKWVEAWLSSDGESVIDRFRVIASALGMHGREGYQPLKFPERSVHLLFANQAQLLALIDASDDLAELRAAREPCNFFLDIAGYEQADWVRDLLARTTFDDASDVAICILDGGINAGHPLINAVLAASDQHAVMPHWGTHDHDPQGHGTLMAGIAAYGDLQEALESSGSIEVRHVIESSKILPPGPQQNPPELWGSITAEGIYRAEIQAPLRNRVVCMAVTAMDTRDSGRPTSWSAELDQLAAGVADDKRRLIVVSAGNIDNPAEWTGYPASNVTNEVHDPAQSWNALTVGAYTDKTQIMDPNLAGYSAIAPAGGLSPCSTTSTTWPSNMWPIKPEIVLEGGNIARDPAGSAVEVDDLLVLSTRRLHEVGYFAPFGRTSAATAHAAYLAAQVLSEYPQIWPETVRGLLVHSAEWTLAMLGQIKPADGKSGYRQLLRSCGYGVPNLKKALTCLRNRLTLVSESTLTPYRKKDDGSFATNELHVYELPWPKQQLAQLGEAPVKMRVTLSYFIEPGPGEIGWKDRYRYASHGLRFDVIGPTETNSEFLKRLNAQSRAEDEGHPGTTSASSYWMLGQQRDAGSIHSDIWTGTAADLANSNLLTVRPTVGWWRERAYLNRWDRSARYTLIVSIETPSQDIDIYTSVANMIKVPVEVGITI